jgi:hypothetical protein
VHQRRAAFIFWGKDTEQNHLIAAAAAMNNTKKYWGKKKSQNCLMLFSVFKTRGIFGIAEGQVFNFIVGKSDKYLF